MAHNEDDSRRAEQWEARVRSYGVRFNEPIAGIAALAEALPSRITRAQDAGEDPDIIQRALRVKESIEGSPGGSQALAIFETLSRDIRVTNEFLSEAISPRTPEGVELRQHVVQLNKLLLRMQELVDTTPADVVKAMKREFVVRYGSDRERHHEEVGMPVMYLFVAIAVAAFLAYYYFHILSFRAMLMIAVPAIVISPFAASLAAGFVRKRKGY